jgi:hypothetical protein
MADLVLRRADGWVEVTEYIDDLIRENILTSRELWGWAGQGNVQDLNKVFDLIREDDDFEEFFDLIGLEPVTGLFVANFPDDFLGSLMHVWLKRRGGVLDWTPQV